MYKSSLQSFLLVFSLLLALVSSNVISETTNAEEGAPPSMNVNVDHTVQILDGGLVVINDTIDLSTKPGEYTSPLNTFLMGFPFNYSFNLDYCFAYDSSNIDIRFDVLPDIDLGRSGYYGVEIIFPEAKEISNGGSYSFTAVFVFSNLVSSINETVYTFGFPMYPSLLQKAALCNVLVTLPSKANHTDSSFREKSLNFSTTTLNSKQVITHKMSPLNNFAHKHAWLTFEGSDGFEILNAKEVIREVKVDEWKQIFITDSYLLTNKAERDLSRIETLLPPGAYDVSAWDGVGELSIFLEEKTNTYTNTTVILRRAMEKNESGRFTVTYKLPWENYVHHYGWDKYNFGFIFIRPLTSTVRRLSVTITLPEGAELQTLSETTENIKKEMFQETINFAFQNVTSFHKLDLAVTYNQFMFWASFRPTMWIGTLIVIFSVLTRFRRLPIPSVPITPVSPEVLRSFVDSYEEKARILSNLKSLEQQVRRRKLPRRRYRARRRTMEGRLSSLSRHLTNLREKIFAAGPLYADMMRRIEIAETEFEEVETNIRVLKSRYSLREISSSTHQKLNRDYTRKKDRAKTTIEGVLLQIRGEIS